MLQFLPKPVYRETAKVNKCDLAVSKAGEKKEAEKTDPSKNTAQSR